MNGMGINFRDRHAPARTWTGAYYEPARIGREALLNIK